MDGVVHTARELMEDAYTARLENFNRARADLLMVDGESQWSAEDREKRREDGRPCLTLNRLPGIVRRVSGRARRNRLSVNVTAVQEDIDVPDKGGSKKYTMAQVMEGRIRLIERKSQASRQAYATAVENAAACGLGWIRVIPQEPTGLQISPSADIRIKRVPNPMSIIGDPSSIELDGSDMDYAFCYQTMSEPEFKAKYPGASMTDVDTYTSDMQDRFLWFKQSGVVVAEYYHRKMVDDDLVILEDGRVLYGKEMELFGLIGSVNVAHERACKRPEIKSCVISGVEVLDERETLYIPWLPVVPVYGAERFVPGIGCIYESVIRHSHDAQRQYNYFSSGAAEAIDNDLKAPFAMTVEQIKGHEDQWEDSSDKYHPFLLYNHVDEQPPPQRLGMSKSIGAEIQMALMYSDDIKATSSVYDASLGARGNETSGRAIAIRDDQSELGQSVWHDNTELSVAQVGNICLWMTRLAIGVEEQTIRIMHEDGSYDRVTLNQLVEDDDGSFTVNDILSTTFEAAVTTGPGFDTEREEASQGLLEFMRIDPESAPLLGHLLVRNLNFPMAQEAARLLRSRLPAELVGSDEEKKQAEDQPPSPEQLEAQAKVAKAQADLIEAETAKLEAEMKMQGLEGGDLVETIRKVVAEAVAELLQGSAA